MARKKHRTAAQKAATRKMIAANKSRHRRKPAKTSHKRRKSTSTVVVAAPRKTRVRVARTNPSRRRRRISARHNPSHRGGFMGALTSSLMPAVWGAGGAIAVSALSGIVVSKAPLPAALKAGYGKVAVDILLATALGTFGRRFLGNKASMMASGAMTVIAFNALAPMVGKVVPGMSGLPGSLDALPGSLDSYDAGQIGYYSPAETFSGNDESMGDTESYMGDSDDLVGEYTYT